MMELHPDVKSNPECKGVLEVLVSKGSELYKISCKGMVETEYDFFELLEAFWAPNSLVLSCVIEGAMNSISPTKRWLN